MATLKLRICYVRLMLHRLRADRMLLVLVLQNVNGVGKNSLDTLRFKQ
jgi:hypothetical protein